MKTFDRIALSELRHRELELRNKVLSMPENIEQTEKRSLLDEWETVLDELQIATTDYSFLEDF